MKMNTILSTFIAMTKSNIMELIMMMKAMETMMMMMSTMMMMSKLPSSSTTTTTMMIAKYSSRNVLKSDENAPREMKLLLQKQQQGATTK